MERNLVIIFYDFMKQRSCNLTPLTEYMYDGLSINFQNLKSTENAEELIS